MHQIKMMFGVVYTCVVYVTLSSWKGCPYAMPYAMDVIDSLQTKRPFRNGRILFPPGLAESGYPLPTYIFLITPPHVFCGLIWAIYVFGIISIWQIWVPPPWRLAKSGCPLPLTNGKIRAPLKRLHPPSLSNVFWTKLKFVWNYFSQ